MSCSDIICKHLGTVSQQFFISHIHECIDCQYSECSSSLLLTFILCWHFKNINRPVWVLCYCIPVNMPDSIRKRFGYGQLWLSWPACSQNLARLYMPNLTSRLRFGSIFPKKAWTILCKTDPSLIWMTLTKSHFGQTYLVHKQASV